MIVINIPFPLIFLYWYGIVQALAFFYYSLWLRFQVGTYITEGTKQTYLAFCIIGMLGYIAIAGPCFLTAYKYSTTQKVRSKRMRIGVCGIFFTGTLVLFALDLDMVWKYKVVGILQGIQFILQLISFWFGALGVWFIYMWQVASYLHKKTGTDRMMMFRQGALANLRVPPPLTWSKRLPGQPEIV